MTIEETGLIIEALSHAYPWAFPKGDTEQSVEDLGKVIIVWFADFEPYPFKLVEKAAGHMRRNFERPSIKALTDSIVAVSGFPSLYQVKDKLTEPEPKDRQNPIIKAVFNALGGYTNIINMNNTTYEIEAQKAYKVAIKGVISEAITGNNWDLLPVVADQKLLEG